MGGASAARTPHSRREAGRRRGSIPFTQARTPSAMNAHSSGSLGSAQLRCVCATSTRVTTTYVRSSGRTLQPTRVPTARRRRRTHARGAGGASRSRGICTIFILVLRGHRVMRESTARPRGAPAPSGAYSLARESLRRPLPGGDRSRAAQDHLLIAAPCVQRRPSGAARCFFSACPECCCCCCTSNCQSTLRCHTLW